MATSPTIGAKRRRSTLEIPIRENPASHESTSGLCDMCLKLPLEKGFDGAVTKVDEKDYWPRLDVKIANVGTYYRQTSDLRCDLCRLLCDSRVSIHQLEEKPENGEDSDELRAFDVARDNTLVDPNGNTAERERLLKAEDSRYLAVVPSGAVFRRSSNSKAMAERGERQGFLTFRRRASPQPNIFASRIVGPKFDASLGKEWLSHCDRHHKKSCSGAERETNGLRLINCHSAIVEPARSEPKYIALSYVWGNDATENSSQNVAGQNSSDCVPLPTDLPAVVMDAMEVTIQMGFDHIWIDKYCINQNNKADKHGQISQMDSIYYNAEATIVAAAGSDSAYGLPGMSRRSRQLHPSVTVKGTTITSTLKNPQREIQSSKWSTRGWTLQEAVLSRRCLVFTDEQVYFECRAMNCHESLSTPLEKLHVKDGSKFRSILRSGIFVRSSTYQAYGLFDETKISPMYNFLRFTGMIQQYTARDLSYDSDSLSAFSGIIGEFENSKNSTGQVCGIPFIPNDPQNIGRSFLCGLTWYHLIPPEKEQYEPRPRRRKDFPSWSWAGWAGKVSFVGRDSIRSLPFDAFAAKYVSIRNENGVVFDPFSDVQEKYVGGGSDTSPQYLQIQAPVVLSSLFSYDSSSTPPSLKMDHITATMCLSTGPWDLKDFKDSLDKGRRQCIYWGDELYTNVVMVLQAEVGETWSRVGLILLEATSYSVFREQKIKLRGEILGKFLNV